MFIRLVLLQFLFLSALFASPINIAVAANLAYVLPKLKAEFLKSYPSSQLHITIGGSGKLAIQIERGAGYDLFLSANTEYVTRLYREGKTLKKPKVYAQGALVLLSRKKRDFSKGMKILTQSDIKKVALANPKTAPYGKASVEALKKSGIYEIVEPKIVYAESVSQTLVYTLRATDMGFVAKSALFAPNMKRFQKGTNWIDVPDKLYTPISQAAALLLHAKGNEEAEAFYDFLFGHKAKEIFQAYGYKVP